MYCSNKFEKELSLNAIGLYSVMIDLPVRYLVPIEFLALKSGATIKEVEEALNELIITGYVLCVNMLYTINIEKFIQDINELMEDDEMFFEMEEM
ncbi:MAG: hypothetical protein IJS61_08605 [Firmicutes bacterium]|nr:hypothetical protein [Bacillota bacterium]